MELKEEYIENYSKVSHTLFAINEFKKVDENIPLEEAGVSSIAFLKAMIGASKALEIPFSALNPEELSIKKTLKQTIIYLIKKL